MRSTDILTDSFTRVGDGVARLLDGLTDDQLSARPVPEANSISWLVWHLARVQDDHVADVAGTEQVWVAQDFVTRFDLPFDSGATGFGMNSEEVGHVRVGAALLADYVHAVHEATVAYLATLTPDDLDRVVDERWDPPVTLGVRLVSVVSDDLQHAGQAAYARGLVTAD
jgi:hypothetical protein